MRPMTACSACRDRRKKCDRSDPGLSCKFCLERDIPCIGIAENLAVPLPSGMVSVTYDTLSNQHEHEQLEPPALSIPDAGLREELVDLYFRHVHVAFHNLFHRGTLIASVKDNSISRLLFYGVVSLSARYSSHPFFAATSPWDRGRPYRDETKRLLDVEDVSVTSIQACIILAANASVEGNPHVESVYHALASRMAVLLDLPTLPCSSLLEQEINRRVWWSLITMETWTSAAQSLPRTIKPRSTVPLPMNENNFASLTWDTPLPSYQSPGFTEDTAQLPHESSRSPIAQMIRLNLLLHEIILHNVRLVLGQAGSSAGDTAGLDLAHSLEDWANNLLPEMRYSDANVARWTQEGYGTTFIIMHINYNHAGQLLFYQHLQSVSDTEQSTFATAMAQVFARQCKVHATNLCDIIHRANQQPETLILYPLAGHILSLASTVQIHTVLFSADDGMVQAAKSRLERNFQIISYMDNYWPMNHRSISRLQHFHNACMRSQDGSFRFDVWMLRFLLGFMQDVGDRDASRSESQSSSEFDQLRNLLEMQRE